MALLMSTSAFAAIDHTFIRPYGAYISPSNNHVHDIGTMGIAAGTAFGSQQQQEVSVDVMYGNWHDTFSYTGEAAYTNIKNMPVLACYRYYLFNANENIRSYAGMAGGIAGIRADSRVIGSNSNESAQHSSSWVPAWAGCIGLKVKVTKSIDIDLGYRYLWEQEKTIVDKGHIVQLDSARGHILYAGVEIKF